MGVRLLWSSNWALILLTTQYIDIGLKVHEGAANGSGHVSAKKKLRKQKEEKREEGEQ